MAPPPNVCGATKLPCVAAERPNATATAPTVPMVPRPLLYGNGATAAE
jgi:hypothetical protein